MHLFTFFTNCLNEMVAKSLSVTHLIYQPIVFSSDEIINTTGEKSTTPLSMKPSQRYKHRGCDGGVFGSGSAGVTLRSHTEPTWS